MSNPFEAEEREMERQWANCSGGPDAHEDHMTINGECPWNHDGEKTRI